MNVEKLGIESMPGMLEQLSKAFHELEAHRQSTIHNQTKWEDVKGHFLSTQILLKEKLDEQEGKEKAFEERKFDTNELIREKKLLVASKEQVMVDRLQQLKDVAVSAITEARNKYNVAIPELVDLGENKGNKVRTSTNVDTNALVSAPGDDLPDTGSGEPVDLVGTPTKPRPELKELCEKMDLKGLLKFLSENHKHLNILRQELSHALKSAKEPARLVLDSLEGFYPPELLNFNEDEMTALQGLRRTCILLMESVASILGPTESSDHHPVSSENKELAKAMANEWKAKLAAVDLNRSNGNSLEAQAFLQLLASFSISSDFDEEELCKLVHSICRRRQAPHLCRSLGLTHRMPGVVDALINNGKYMDAFHFIDAFQLTDIFQLVPLLKEYLDDTIKKAQEKIQNAKHPFSPKGSHGMEMNALKTVIKCIEEYKLQQEYPLEPLRKRISELTEKAKTEKRPSEADKPVPKRSKGNAGYPSGKPLVNNKYRRSGTYGEMGRGSYAGATERFPYVAPPGYKVPSNASYSSQQATAQNPFYYAGARAPPAPYGVPADYGGHLGSGAQPASTNYGNYWSAEMPQQTSSSNYGNYVGSSMQSLNQPQM